MTDKQILEEDIVADDAYDIFLGMSIIAYGMTKIEFATNDKTIRNVIDKVDTELFKVDQYLKKVYPESKDEDFIIQFQDRVSNYLNKLK
jgi:hypothetical protein